MAAKKEFDLVMLSIGGMKFAVPKAAAMEVFEAFCGQEMYRMWDTWERSGNVMLAEAASSEYMPTLTALNPAIFHAALLEQERREAEKAKKEST